MLHSSAAEIKWEKGPLEFFACFYSKKQRGQCHLQSFDLGCCLWLCRVGLDSMLILPLSWDNICSTSTEEGKCGSLWSTRTLEGYIWFLYHFEGFLCTCTLPLPPLLWFFVSIRLGSVFHILISFPLYWIYLLYWWFSCLLFANFFFQKAETCLDP